MSKYSVLVGLFLSLLSSRSEAYFISSDQAQAIDYARPTHVIVAGFADELAEEFMKSAASRALRLRVAYPTDQILVFRGNERDYRDARSGVLARGLSLLESPGEDLTGGRLLSILAKFSAIRSLAIFSHSGPFNGVRTSEEGTRFHAGLGNIERLRGRFAPDAYVALYGCNSVHDAARRLSRAWGVPVSGSATGTDFEELFSDGRWYMHNPGQYPSSLGRAARNAVSLDGGVSCSKAGCSRMRPQNSRYDGVWGTFEAGLPFYKFMCDFDSRDADAEARCLRGMARSLVGFVSVKNLTWESPLEDFREVMLDYFCPSSSRRDGQASCREKILKAESEGNPVLNVFAGNPLECSLRSCQSRFESEEVGFWSTRTIYRMYAPVNRSSRTLMEEWGRMLRGLSLLGK